MHDWRVRNGRSKKLPGMPHPRRDTAETLKLLGPIFSVRAKQMHKSYALCSVSRAPTTGTRGHHNHGVQPWAPTTTTTRQAVARRRTPGAGRAPVGPPPFVGRSAARPSPPPAATPPASAAARPPPAPAPSRRACAHLLSFEPRSLACEAQTALSCSESTCE
jgi:hypothetical protein